MDDVNVFGARFCSPTWSAWCSFLAALFGLPMTPEQLAALPAHTGRTTAAERAVVMRPGSSAAARGGKSFILALVAVFLACFRDWRPFLGPGEVAHRHDHCPRSAASAGHQALHHRPVACDADVAASDRERDPGHYRAARWCGDRNPHRTVSARRAATRIIAALFDELAYWPSDEHSSEPDVEIINAIRPGMATIPGAMLLCASSPHARKGALWSALLASTTARTVIRFWCGGRRRAR